MAKKRTAKNKANRSGGTLARRSAAKSSSKNNAKKLLQAQQFLNTGQLAEAEQVYRKILEADPGNAEVNYQLAALYFRAGNSERAEPYARASVDSDPTNFDALGLLAYLLHSRELYDQALDVYTLITQVRPKDPAVWNEFGKLWRDSGEFEKAIECTEKAIELQPDFVPAFDNLGYAYVGLGQSDKAVECYRKALDIEPGFAKSLYGLAQARKFKPEDSLIANFEEQYRCSATDSDARMHIAFALGKIYEDTAQYDAAFEKFMEANRIQRRGFQYSLPAHARQLEVFRKVLGSEFQQAHAGAGLEDDCPIFIVGMPRSGTSLVEQILASHPEVHGAGEVNYLRVVAMETEKLTRLPFPQGIEQLDSAQLHDMAASYIAMLKKSAQGQHHVTDKHLYNVNCLGFISAIMPQAKIVHCVRDPMDTCVSIFTHMFTPLHGYAADLTELGQYYRLYEQHVAYWHELLPGHIHQVEYESMVADPEQQIRALLDYCGLDFDERCLNFHRTQRSVNTPSATQVRRPIYGQSVRRWKRYEHFLTPLQRALGQA